MSTEYLPDPAYVDAKSLSMTFDLKLKEEVAHFREWANSYPKEERNGEWECDYSDWPSLNKAVLELVENIPMAVWTPEILDAVLYAIARDNECEYLAGSIGEQHPQIVLPLVQKALEQGEAEAKWQLAVQLGRAGVLSDEVEDVLCSMVRGDDEYPRRRALMELARLNSPHTEDLALLVWLQPHENQQWARMAALWCLHRVQSHQLEKHMNEAEADPRPYLSDYAKRLRRGEVE